MAMEKLVAVQRDPRFDLVILDTPPTTNALDFLDAPGRLVEAVDSPTMRWFVQAFESTGKVGFNLLARSAAVVLRGLGRITGGGFLAAMAEFITELNDLFGGFKQRAQMVENSLRSPEVSFVVVASPAPVSLEEAVFFSERLGRANMPRGAFVVNRFRLPPLWTDRPPSAGDAAKAIAAHGLHLEEDAPERVVRAHADAVRLAKRDAANVRSLGERASDEVPIVRVPELASDVHDLKNLRDIAEMLMSGGV
jgi:anion-transporting  ArsA/GET3 family ATPase